MSLRRPILLTGATGQVGWELLPLLQALGPVVAPLRADLDLTDTTAVRSLVRSIQPRWIINPAAYTAVDKAETDKPTAYAMNSDLPQVLGEEAVRCGAPVLHFSTDYVFSGDGIAPWREGDPPSPLGIYGASKLAGERALQKSSAPHLIFRTSWVYGVRGNNFLLTILKLAREREELKVVADQYGAPTWSRNLARLIAHTITHCEVRAATSGRTVPDEVQRIAGVYHACDMGTTTWFGFATEIVKSAQLAEPDQQFAQIRALSAADFPMPAQRPYNSRLSCEKLRRSLEFTMPVWQESVAAVIKELLA